MDVPDGAVHEISESLCMKQCSIRGEHGRGIGNGGRSRVLHGIHDTLRTNQ